MAANPSGAHQAGELSLAKTHGFGRAGIVEQAPARPLRSSMDRGPGRATLCHSKTRNISEDNASNIAFILSNSQIGTMTAEGDVACAS
jgi:hypothetical protein